MRLPDRLLRRRQLAVLAASAATLLIAAAPASAAKLHFLAGAGEADTTPPLAGTAAGDAADAAFAKLFSTCSTAFSSPGRFALQEPFQDLNGTGQWDAGFDLSNGPDGNKPDPFCDANANGNWDGIYADNGWGPASGVHDPLDARAVAISDGRHRPVVYASVKAIGLFDAYTEDARQILAKRYGVHADLVVSADHNESSPDTIGLYGALETPLGVGVRSGIDEFYMRYLDDRIARAAAAAVRSMRPATLYANQVGSAPPDGSSGNRYPLLTGMSQRISDQFPTTVALPKDNRIAAVDPKLGVLQARGRDGQPIFTVISLAAHNQEMGNAGAALSGDWPAAMERSFDATHAGMAMFLVGDNGSEEDPQTDPTVVPNGSENHTNPATQWLQAQATGARFAAIASDAASNAVQLTPGAVRLERQAICVPLENNGFLALAMAGDFGRRQAWVCDSSGHPLHAIPNGTLRTTAGAEFRTFVSFADIGPDLQLIDNPGESFPALMLGSPFGVEDESCPRPNPAVPTWYARGVFRFQVGLADDLIGYLIPAWGFASGVPGLFNDDTCYSDQNGHGHKLESESVGPTGGNDVANTLASMLSSQPDPSAHVVTGRYILANGSLSRWPTGAVGVLLSGDGATLDAAHGALIGDPRTPGFGARTVDQRGVFMDYDGQPQARPDVTTRGIMVLGEDGCVAARYYLNVFPTLSESGALGAATSGPAQLPHRTCVGLMQDGVPELQPAAALAAGLRAARLR
jgi:hypothetical protein